jgi:hypothetical protein
MEGTRQQFDGGRDGPASSLLREAVGSEKTPVAKELRNYG